MSNLQRTSKHRHHDHDQRNGRRVAIENVEFLREDQNRQNPYSSEHQHHRHQTYPASQDSSKEVLLTNQELSAAETPFTGAAAPPSELWYNYGGYFYPPTPYGAIGGVGGQQNQQQPPSNSVAGQQKSPSASHSKQTPPKYGPQYGAYYPYYFPGGYPPPPPSSSMVNYPKASQQYAPPWLPYPYPMMGYPQQQHRDQSSPLQQQPQEQEQEQQHPLKSTSAEESVPASRMMWSNPPRTEESASLLRKKTATGYGSTATRKKNVSAPAKSVGSVPLEPSNQPPPLDNMLSPNDRPTKAQEHELHRSMSSEAPVPLPRKHSRPPPHHRRVKSDIPQREARQKPRPAGLIPPSDPIRTRKQFPPADSRKRTWSGQQVEFSEPVKDGAPRSNGGGSVGTPHGSSSHHHRRVSSLTGASLYTDTSVLSVVTDIRKSSFFQGYDEEGRAEMNYPFTHVHLTMSKNLPRGELFKVPTNERRFEDYHLITDSSELDLYGFEDLDRGCNCSCDQCHACTGKQNLLPPNYYVLKVEDDIYRRMIDEICASREMPCGLFFCGHHEDVSHPSIFIPVAFLILLMIAMGITAYILRI